MNSSKLTDNEKSNIRLWSNDSIGIAFERSAEQCWRYLNRTRISSLCYVCAADNYRYFYEDKAVITVDECKIMASQCRTHFSLFLNMIENGVYLNKATILIHFLKNHRESEE